MQTIPTWLWPAAGWTLVAAGLWPLLLGRWRWRALTGRLCRTCRYDMAGLPGLTCPECGRTARNERELSKRRPGHLIRVLGAALLLLGLLTPRAPEIVKRGWVGALPDWALARLAPATDPTFAWLNEPGEYKQPFPVVGRACERMQKSLYSEAQRRLNTDEISESAGTHYLRRAEQAVLGSLDLNLRAPPFWPSGERWIPAYFPATTRGFDTSFQIHPTITAQIGKVDEARGTIKVELIEQRGSRGYVLGSVVRPIDLSRSAHEVMEPANSPEIDAAVAAAMRPTIALKDRQTELLLFEGRETLTCFATCTVTLRVKGDPVFTQSCDLAPSSHNGDNFGRSFALTKAESAVVLEHLDALEVEITGDPDRAIGLYRTAWWLDSSNARPKAWNGTIRVKPDIERRWIEPKKPEPMSNLPAPMQ